MNVFLNERAEQYLMNVRYVLISAVAMAAGVAAIAGCERPTWKTYAAALESGRRNISVVPEIEATIPGEAQHFITHYGFHRGPNTWNTEALLLDRYVLTMKVKVQLDRSYSRVVDVVNEPRFSLVEVVQIEKMDDGRWRNGYGDQWQFGPDRWKQVVDADGDFSVIGIDLKQDAPVENFQALHGDVRAGREPPRQ